MYILCRNAVELPHHLGGNILSHSDKAHKQLPGRISALKKQKKILKKGNREKETKTENGKLWIPDTVLVLRGLRLVFCIHESLSLSK